MLGHLTLALQHMDSHCSLVIIRRGKHLVGLGRNGRVFLDQLGHHAAEGFDTERQRCDIEQQHIFDISSEHAALDGSTYGHRLIGIDVTPGLLAEEIFYRILHLGHPGLPPNQKHIIDIRGREPCVLECGLAGVDSAADQIIHQRLKLGPGQFQVEVLGATLVCRDIGQIDFGLRARGKLDLGLFSTLFQPLHGQRIAAQIHSLIFLELVRQVIDQPAVKIFPTEEGISVGRKHFKLVLTVDVGDLDNRDVESTPAEIVHRDLPVTLLFFKTVSQRSCGRLIDDTFDVKTCNPASILGGLAL